MPDYLLDTTAIIDYLRDKSDVPALLEKACLAVKNRLILVTNNPKHFPHDELTILSYERIE